MMNNDMHELQQQLEEVGFGDMEEDFASNDGKSSKNSLLKNAGKGGKQIMKILKKSRKMITNTKKTKKQEVEFRQQSDELQFEESTQEYKHPQMLDGTSLAVSDPKPQAAESSNS